MPNVRNTALGMPGINPRMVRVPPAIVNATGLPSCLVACCGADSEVDTLDTTSAVAKDKIRAGNCATRPSPIVNNI